MQLKNQGKKKKKKNPEASAIYTFFKSQYVENLQVAQVVHNWTIGMHILVSNKLAHS